LIGTRNRPFHAGDRRFSSGEANPWVLERLTKGLKADTSDRIEALTSFNRLAILP
jgi:hypothetical protein